MTPLNSASKATNSTPYTPLLVCADTTDQEQARWTLTDHQPSFEQLVRRVPDSAVDRRCDSVRSSRSSVVFSVICFFPRHPPHRDHRPGKFGLLANGAAHGGVSTAAIAAKESPAAADVFFAEKYRRCVVFGLAMRTGRVSFHYMHYPRLSSMSSGEMYDRSGKFAQTIWRVRCCRRDQLARSQWRG